MDRHRLVERFADRKNSSSQQSLGSALLGSTREGCLPLQNGRPAIVLHASDAALRKLFGGEANSAAKLLGTQMMIATRSLLVQNSAGETEIPVRIFAPELKEENVWSCRYEIDWPDGKWTIEAWGIDSVQALVSALQMIGSELYTCNYHRAGALKLEGGNGGYGFPVPSSLRDMLVGDDAKYF